MLGETLGHYRVHRKLGEGGMGEVYLAEDLTLKRKVAIKVISPDLVRNEGRRERFIQEATLAASIDHPHIAAIYAIDQAGDRTYIAMEYIRGETLRELLKTGPPPLRRVLDLAIQIADALAKVHLHGVTHRDLKPENVIVSDDGYAKVIDFGLAKLTEHVPVAADVATATGMQVRTAEGLVLGTFAYMSPEQARGARVDARSDIFSFGVLLHELLTGIAPFRRDSAAETVSAILTTTPPDVAVSDAAIAPELQRIVRKSLMKDAEARYQSMREVVVDLRGVRDVLAGTRATTTAAPAAASAPALPRWALATLASAVLAIVAVSVWLWTRGTTSPPAAGSGRPALAVMNFDNVSGAAETAWLSAGLPSMLVTGLAQNPEIEVVTVDRLNEAARQVGSAQFAAIEPARRQDAVRRAGATIVVNGTIIRAADELRIDARVEDLASGRVVLADTVRGRDPIALADDLAARIRRQLNVRTADAVRSVGQLSSSSIEAYRLFALGVEAGENVRSAEAVALLKQAVALDPNFALAHLWIYRAGGLSVGGLARTERLEHLKQAVAHVDRLSERDALIVEANLAEAEGRLDDALVRYEKLMARYPDVRDGYVGATTYYVLQSNAGRAVDIMERAVAALPNDGPAFNILGYIYLGDGRGADAIRAFETYVKLRPREPNALDSLAEGHLAAGNLEKAMEIAQQAKTAGHPGSRTTVAWIQSVQGQYDDALREMTTPSVAAIVAHARVGRYRDAEARLAKGISGTGLPDEAIAAIAHVLRAMFALERGNCRGTLAWLAAAAKASSPPPRQALVISDVLSGTCEARTGQLDAARARLAQHRSSLTSGSFELIWLLRLLEGEIALAAGDARAAAAAFEAAGPARRLPFNRSGAAAFFTLMTNSLILRDGLARARVAEGRPEAAIAIYRQLLRADGESKFTGFYEPRYVLAIARLLEKSGRREESRQEYARFLDLWKQADAELPELAEARAKTR
jgi:tetratricopeptide (TPR) repeat protein/tRNA A-37 threonylcarbamoyl transferase component Bud32